ncbi:origin recognition complex subunit 1 isoform X2 [Cimex lectularius]|uniref:Origin recognition complex subunit 1 n=1 Tax=Cimex lectularius TaxID=79782 RepID=A0A8I6SK02_CIMLE|nr:origin recognition complex subunit 1 isoform X2 [Cimex lectularius]
MPIKGEKRKVTGMNGLTDTDSENSTFIDRKSKKYRDHEDAYRPLSEQEIHDILMNDDDDDDESSNDDHYADRNKNEWEVDKIKTPNSKTDALGLHASAKRSIVFSSPSPRKENCKVSPLKLKRKLEYAVDKVSSPSTKHAQNVVSPIIIKRKTEIQILTPSKLITTSSNIVNRSEDKMHLDSPLKRTPMALVNRNSEDVTTTPKRSTRKLMTVNEVTGKEETTTPRRSTRKVMSSVNGNTGNARTPRRSTRTPRISNNECVTFEHAIMKTIKDSGRKLRERNEEDGYLPLLLGLSSDEESEEMITERGLKSLRIEEDKVENTKKTLSKRSKRLSEVKGKDSESEEATSPANSNKRNKNDNIRLSSSPKDTTNSDKYIPVKSRNKIDDGVEPLELKSPRKLNVKSDSDDDIPFISSPRVLRSCSTKSRIVATPKRVTRSSIAPSPRTPSLRKRVLEANTPKVTPKSAINTEELMKTPVSSSRSPSVRKKLMLTPATPHSLKKIGHGFLTPVAAERDSCAIKVPKTGLDFARSQLQVATLPSSLPCREKEFSNIKSFLLRKLEDMTGGCMYISGVPGTGKTATVHTVVKTLQKESQDDEVPAFDFVEVNGLRLTEPRQAYVRIWQTLTKNKLTPEQALKSLEDKFTGKNKRCCILLVDELDYLCNKRQDVIYNILDWTTKRNSKLVVLTIANTMDLPERTLKGKVTSRMGLTRLVFQPYTFQQLQQIVMNRLNGCTSFQADAVQLVARKVAAVSGDARRALDICRRSTELLESKSEVVTVQHIQKALNQIFTGIRVQAIKKCSQVAQLILRSLRDEVIRTGVEESTVSLMLPQLIAVCAMESCPTPTIGDILSVCSGLANSGLIIIEKGRGDLNTKLSLNVSPDDIHYALNC